MFVNFCNETAAARFNNAVELLGGIHKTIEQPGITPVAGFQTFMDNVVAKTKESIGEAQFRESYNKGHQMKYEETIDFALRSCRG